jgi:hypothetical protein
MNTFSEQQIRSYKRTLASFETVRYNLLLAQMQSGKTDTYHLIACEMLRMGLIEQIIIFSGNREKELFEQKIIKIFTNNLKYNKNENNYEANVDNISLIIKDIMKIYLNHLI